MTVFLVGYRGAGKSTVGKIVAEKLNLKLYCLDQLLEEAAGKSITDFVAEKGWDAFRDLEEQILRQYCVPGVVDCGGGIIERASNRKLLKSKPLVFFLKTDVNTLMERLKNKSDRPALSGDKDFISEITEIYTRRIPLYEEVSDFVMDAGKPSEEVAEEILSLIKD